MWQQHPAVADWWARVRERPSVKATIFDRMQDADWAPFKKSGGRPMAQGAIASEGGLSADVAAPRA